jgi:hypothetical protein
MGNPLVVCLSSYCIILARRCSANEGKLHVINPTNGAQVSLCRLTHHPPDMAGNAHPKSWGWRSHALSVYFLSFGVKYFSFNYSSFPESTQYQVTYHQYWLVEIKVFIMLRWSKSKNESKILEIYTQV